MYIAFFTNNYLPNPYGVTVSVETLRKELEKRGHTASIFAPEWKGYEDTNLYVHRFPSIEFSYKIRFPLTIPYSPEIERIFEKEKFDIIHSQHPNLAGFAAKRIAKKKHIPLIFTWHTLYDQYVHFAPPFIPKKLAIWWVIREAVKYANASDAVIVPTDSVREVIVSWGVRNPFVYVIPTGVDEEKYATPYKENFLQEQYQIPKNATILFTASRLTQEKNIVFLVKSIIQVLKNNPRIWFVIGGEGNLAQTLKDLAKQNGVEKRIILTGLIEGKDMKHFLASSDIFVYASKSETQGMVIAEAMYVGLPVVAVRAPGVRDLVKDKKTGILVDENERLFQKAVESLVKDKQQKQILAQNSKKVAQETLTSSICAEKVFQVYKEAIQSQ